MQLTGINQLWVADITYIRLPRKYAQAVSMAEETGL
jgi:hypothetical protein